jgi:hypothetical protein
MYTPATTAKRMTAPRTMAATVPPLPESGLPDDVLSVGDEEVDDDDDDSGEDDEGDEEEGVLLGAVDGLCEHI